MLKIRSLFFCFLIYPFALCMVEEENDKDNNTTQTDTKKENNLIKNLNKIKDFARKTFSVPIDDDVNDDIEEKHSLLNLFAACSCCCTDHDGENGQENSCSRFADFTVRFNGVKDFCWFYTKLFAGTIIIIYAGYQVYVIYTDIYNFAHPIIVFFDGAVKWCTDVEKQLAAEGVNTKDLFQHLAEAFKNGTVQTIRLIKNNNATFIEACRDIPMDAGKMMLNTLDFFKKNNISISSISNDTLTYLIDIGRAFDRNNIDMYKFINDLIKTGNDISLAIGKIANIQVTSDTIKNGVSGLSGTLAGMNNILNSIKNFLRV